MSKLISMRQRIKAIETIKKVTHTMQMISMSTHTKLKKKQTHLTLYVEAIKQVYKKTVYNQTINEQAIDKKIPDKHQNSNSSETEKNNQTKLILLIVVGSQKGLCGNFNNQLFHHINADSYLANNHDKIACITIGQKAINEIKIRTSLTPILTFDQFTYNTYPTITENIMEHINSTVPAYTEIVIWNNKPKTFFIQKPHATFLLSAEHATETIALDTDVSLNNKNIDSYMTEQPTDEIINFLKKQFCEAQLEMLLFESLLAEQAARFVSMDSATRNAKNMLDDLTLQFNKIRQAKITKELTELIGSF